MASTMPKPVSAKQLRELLQEQQEPFILEVYLLERGYKRSNSYSKASFRCCSRNSSTFLKRSASNKRRKATPKFSKIVKAVFNKLTFSSNNQKVKNSVSGDGNSNVGEIGRRNQETAEPDGLSSASSMTVFNSCSESDTEDASQKHSISATAETSLAFRLGNLLQGNEVVTDRQLQWRCREDKKELSPVSVLEEIPSNEGSPVHDSRQQNAKTRDSILAVPFRKFSLRSSNDPSGTGDTASQGLGRPGPSSQYLTAKRVLQQSKQLLFDCVGELVENGAWKDRRRQQSMEILGPEELGKLLSEEMRTWSKLSGKEANTTQLLNSNFMASVAEWSNFESPIREIGAEIGDVILEDISKEIVQNMIELVEPHLCPHT